jgi:transcriptional regulator with XRE-family HTH domain
MYEFYSKLRDKKGLKDADVAKITGITKSTFSDWKSGRSNPKNDKLQKIATCLEVPIDWLISGKEPEEPKKPVITPKDERDIKKDVDSIMAKIEAGADGPAAYDGEPLSPESAELFRDALEVALRQIKILNKEKYNPHKNKK